MELGAYCKGSAVVFEQITSGIVVMLHMQETDPAIF